ncbi:MAG TPA: phospho-sugar mutase [Chlamydiales bacterium]|jgi:phosphoglucomutase/phosphomannomutase
MLDLKSRVEPWLHAPFDEETRRQVQHLIDTDPKGLSDAFFKDLSFGTGGMRGVMGVGTNRLNLYTIRSATQGLANYLKKQPPKPEGFSVFIGYDVRHHSKEFAENAARVLAANEIKAFITQEICPTPLVSYGCRHFGCDAAIMITASHNPPIYNGYKVYWNDGGQVIAPHDTGIMDEVKRQSSYDVSLASLDSKLVQWVGRELDTAYLEELKELQLYPVKQSIQILYTPLHGTGIRIIPEALKSWGYQDVHLVPEQKKPDGNFSHAPSPNPEEEKALALGTEQLVREKKDLLIATDPDADRMGVVVMDRGKPVRLSGHQIACLCLQHICQAMTEKGVWPSNAACIKTIVTTELFRKIGEKFGAKCVDVLTGFKYIGEQMTLWEKSFDACQYIFGAEESYGYLPGTMVRDKDAISAACLISEVVMHAKEQNRSLVDKLYELYQEYGVHRESLSQIAFSDSAEGMKQMQNLMKQLREKPPQSIGGKLVVIVEDYLTSTHTDPFGTIPLHLPRSDVLRFWLVDHTKLVIRPSGTEPKVKIYAEALAPAGKDLAESVASTDARLARMVEAFSRLCS